MCCESLVLSFDSDEVLLDWEASSVSYKLEAVVVAKGLMHSLRSTWRNTFTTGRTGSPQTHNSKNWLVAPTKLMNTPHTRHGKGLAAVLRKVLRALSDIDILKRKLELHAYKPSLCEVKSSLNTLFKKLIAIMQEMSYIKELYLSANTLQSKFNLRDCVFTPIKNIHCPDTLSKVCWGEEGMQEGKKIHLRSILWLQKAFLRYFCIATIVFFQYNVISLNIHLPGPGSLLSEWCKTSFTR